MSFRPVGLRQAGESAIHRWFTDRSKWSRVIDPLVALLFFDRTTVDVALVQTSVALEAYGYLVLLDDGLTEDEAKDTPFKKRLERAARDLPEAITDLVGEPLESWCQRVADAYNGTKHANRPLPDRRTSWLIALTLAFLLRTRLLQEIGVDDDAVKGLQHTRLWHELRSGWSDVQAVP